MQMENCTYLCALHIADECLAVPLIYSCLGLCGVIFPVMGEWGDAVYIARATCAGLPAHTIITAEPPASTARRSDTAS